MNPALKRRLCLGVFWTAVALFLWIRLGESLVGATVFGAYDILDLYTPWSSMPTAGDEYLSNVYVTDLIDSSIPAISEIQTGLGAGEIPQWSNMVAGGQPLLSGPNLGLAAPGRWAWLVLPITVAPAWAKLFEIAFGMAFAFLFLRRLKLSVFASCVGAFVVPMTGFTIAWTGWAQSSVAIIIPMLFWAVERYIDERRWRDVVPVALAVGLLMFGGFPAVAGHTLYVCGLYAVIRVIGTRTRADWRPPLTDLARLAIGVVLGIALAAIQLLPFIQLTLRGGDLSYRDSMSQSSDTIVSWFTMVLPRSFADHKAAFQDYASYVGAIALLLAALGLAAALRRRIPRGVSALFLGVIGFAILLTIGQGTWIDIVQKLPVFGGNPPGRFRAQLAIPFGAFVAMGIDWLRNDPGESDWAKPLWLKPGFSRSTLVIAGGTSLFLAFPVLYVHISQYASDLRTTWYNDDLRWAYFGLLAAFVLICFAVLIRRLRTIAVALLSVGVVVQALAPTAFFWPIADRDEVYPDSEALDYLSRAVGHNQAGTAGLAARPNVATVYGVRLANGHSFATPAWKEVLMASDPIAYINGGTYSFLNPALTSLIDNPGLDRLGVTHIIASSSEDTLGTLGVPNAMVGHHDEGEIPVRTTSPHTLRAELSAKDLVGVGTYVNSDGTFSASATVTDSEGRVLAHNTISRASTSGTVALDIPLLLNKEVEHSENLTVEVTVTTTSPGTTVMLDTDNESPRRLWGIRRNNSFYPVYVGENAVVYERANALDRFRFASDYDVIHDATERVTAVAQSPVDANSVILSEHPKQTPAAESTGSVNVEVDTGDLLSFSVTSSGGGWLVVEQSVLGRFSATVDGDEAELIEADHAGGAVFVPAGTHEVILSYDLPSERIGAYITVSTTIVLLCLWFVPVVRSRSRSRRVPSGTAPGAAVDAVDSPHADGAPGNTELHKPAQSAPSSLGAGPR